MAAREEVVLVVSQLVIEETRRNLVEVSGDTLPFFESLLKAIPIEYTRPTKRQVLQAAKLVALKDAPILAAAKRAKVDLLVTLDKRHLLDKPELVEYAGLPIVTPKEAFGVIKKTVDREN